MVLLFVHEMGSLVLTPACEPEPSVPGGSQRDAEEPMTEKIGIANRPSLVGQDEKNRLKGILGVVLVNQELPAKPEHHRSVAIHKRAKSSFRGGVTPAVKPLEKRAVGQSRYGSAVEERLDLPNDRARCELRHAHPRDLREALFKLTALTV
jgi:hypothetical protein